jgi:prepilin peptidase CpaA
MYLFLKREKGMNHNLFDTGLILFLGVILLIASIYDLRFQRIPNWLTYPAVIAAIAYHIVINGLTGFLFSLEGLSVGIAVLILFYLKGGIGAGDVKLMGAVGGLLGPKGVFNAFLFTALIGGIYALVLLALYGHLKETVKRYGIMLKTFILTRDVIYIPLPNKNKIPRLCYGVAIALGTLCYTLIGNII